MVSAYADDLAKACRVAIKELITANLQAEVDKVHRWSKDARLQVNTRKCRFSQMTQRVANGHPRSPEGWTTDCEPNAEISWR